VTRPLIGVTTSEGRRPEGTSPTPEGEPPQPEMALGMPYVRALARAGAVPIVLPPLPVELVPALLEPLAGVCLSGGPDIDPAAYGAEPDPELGPVESDTPFLDHELVELAAACPPELKLADGGKGVLKRASRGIVPDAVIDREKGYFPVPALSHLEEPVLGMVRDALLSSDRGLFPRELVTAMLDDPNSHRTNLDGSTLWQLGLLELWMQEHVG
jgi:hypothetical protein